jgi:predicted permease
VNEWFRERDTGLSDRGNHALNLTAALRPGVSEATATQALNVYAAQLSEAYPDTDRNREFVLGGVPRLGVSTRPQPEEETQIVVVAGLLTLMAALVLVVACVNLANLLLARGAARRREIAIRQALGGGRGRIVQQLLVEGLTLALLGAAGGLACAWWSTRALGAWLSGVLPLGFQLVVEPSPRMLPATVGLAVASTLLFALGPAWRLSRPAVADDLRNDAGRTAGRLRAASVLVGLQLAMSLTLVAVGGLFMRGAINAANADPGFAIEGQLVVALDPSLAGYSDAQTRSTYRSVLQNVRSLPGVARASLASIVPFGEMREGRGVALPSATSLVESNLTVVSSDYFETLGIPALRGRTFAAADDQPQPGMAPAVINDRLARRLFGDTPPEGRPIVLRGETDETFVVAGVVGSVMHDLFDREPTPHLYLPYGVRFRAGMTLHVAASRRANEASLLATVQRELRRMDAGLPIVSARTMTTHRDASLSRWAVRASAAIFSTFGALALVLATIGIYGLKAYEVARRKREIGIRMALGATHGEVMRLILRDGARTTAAGLTIGLLMALGIGRLMSTMLYQVSPFDPPTLATAATVLAGATLLAAYLPARRATRVAPTEALRAD